MHLLCCYGLCKSDSRRQEAGVTFIPFPKPNRHPKIARKWVHLCGRHNFTINNINRATYICSKHFPAGALLGRSKNCHIGSWLLNNPTLEPFNALNMLKDEAKERQRVQDISNQLYMRETQVPDSDLKYDTLEPSKVLIQFKEEAKDAEDAEERNIVDPLSMRKSLRAQEEDILKTIDDHKDPADSDIDGAKERKRIQHYLGPSPKRKHLFPDSVKEDNICYTIDDHQNLADTDTASETKSELWQDTDEQHYKIDIDPVPSLHKIILPISPRKIWKKNQEVQADVPMKHELMALQAQAKELRLENKALKEKIEKREAETTHTTECVQKTPNKLNTRFEGENEFSWTKKLIFFTKFTLEQCSALYDDLDPKGREVLLAVVSQANP